MAITYDNKKNFSHSLIAAAPSPADSGTSLEVSAGDGAKFPAAPFNATVWPNGAQPTAGNAEIIRITGKAGDVLTIQREQESSSARVIGVGDQIAATITAKTLTDLQTAVQVASLSATPLGSIVMWLAVDDPPEQWIRLRGQAISRATYAGLFTLWGTVFGVGDGSTTFNVPDWRQRMPIGKTDSGALSTLGATSGSWDHTHGAGTLTVASHTHGPGSLTAASHSHGPGTLAVASHAHSAGTLSTESKDLNHTHSVNIASGGPSALTTTGPSQTMTVVVNVSGGTTGTAASQAHTHDIPDHFHGVVGTSGTMSANSSHSHAVNAGSTASAAPAVSSGATDVAAPAINAGVTAATSPAVSSGATAAANPPVLVVDYIARALETV